MNWDELRKKHYENHLSRNYVKLFGGYEKNLRDNILFFKENGIISDNNGKAWDLGCGCGFQSIPLAMNGFEVFSVDEDEFLLRELEKYAENNNINNIHMVKEDIFSFVGNTEVSPSLIVCMGDTVSHFESVDSVRNFLELCVEKLEKGGYISISFRDYSGEITDENRFVFIGGDCVSFFECFLEKEDGKLKTYDISHIWNEEDHKWETDIGMYFKCILKPEFIDSFFEKKGMDKIHFSNRRGMLYNIYRKK